MVPEPERTIAPGTANIIGTAMNVDTVRTLIDGSKLDGPPMEYIVTFRVDSIKGYGMAFGAPLVAGQLLPVTLPLPPAPPPQPSGAPSDAPDLPGMMKPLHVGNVISGSVELVNDPRKKFYRVVSFNIVR